MAKAIVSYDKDLPEVPEREPHLPPEAYLRKKPDTKDEFEIVEGRRPSKLLLINKLRNKIGAWRADGYPGASDVTQRLFTYWFEEDHLVGGALFRYYYYGQREAVETLVYLIEIEKNYDAKDLIEILGEIFYPPGTQPQLAGSDLVFEQAVGGARSLRRYIPELGSDSIQPLPPEQLRRYAFKLATGSGKTLVMAMMMVWSYYHKRKVPGSDLSTNFLLIAPNIIVYQRLEKDFSGNKLFHTLPLIPPDWKGQWGLKVILRGESAEPNPSGNLFLTNIQQIYASREQDWKPANDVEALLGRKPAKDLASHEKTMLERIKSLSDLIVFNDEAHHVHDEDLQWNQTLMELHRNAPNGLSLWLDFSATPKDQNETYFSWVVCDYPLAQAVEDRIVKAPLIVHRVTKADPENITNDNVVEKYGDWLVAAHARWKEHFKTYKNLGQKPVLFIMAEKNIFADKIGEWLVATKEFGLKKKEVLVIHTDKEGDVSKRDLDVAREAARDIDTPGNPTKVIVSVLMLREGWDVKNVSVVLGLRPFTSDAKILPEQAVGRGLRLMSGISPDRTQTLEVMGTQAFEDFVRQLEAEGVGIKTTTTPPKPPVRIQPVESKRDYDIAIPITQPSYERNYRRLSDLDPMALPPACDESELVEQQSLKLRMDFGITDTEVHQADISAGPPPMIQEILSSLTAKVIAAARLTEMVYKDLYPIVRIYVKYRCFGIEIDLDSEDVRRILKAPLLQEDIAGFLARRIGELTAEKRAITFEKQRHLLSETTPFTWRRNLPLLDCKKTIFNLVATYNDYEKQFAQFLEKTCSDVARFAALGTTEQDSGTTFHVDYIKSSGAIGFYHPDWVVIQNTPDGEVNWIIETKGRHFENLSRKDAAIHDWCSRVSRQLNQVWKYKQVDQVVFNASRAQSFASLMLQIDKAEFLAEAKNKDALAIVTFVFQKSDQSNFTESEKKLCISSAKEEIKRLLSLEFSEADLAVEVFECLDKCLLIRLVIVAGALMLAGGGAVSSMARFLFTLGQTIEQYGKCNEQSGETEGDKEIISRGINLQRISYKLLPH